MEREGHSNGGCTKRLLDTDCDLYQYLYSGASMKTTLDLDRDLLEEAKEALGATSFTEAIEVALREALARTRNRESWNELIGSNLSWEGVDELIQYRRRHGGRAL
jgi:Arc/MetJ family transcription regulator